MKKYEFIGESRSTQKLFNAIDKVAPIKVKVLITGETGVGKELVAYAIHKNSPRSGEKFVKVNCAAIPKDLMESELFGHKKGSFTSAFADQKGKFVNASGGTIFLDEIGELENRAQVILLQVLQDDEILRLEIQRHKRLMSVLLPQLTRISKRKYKQEISEKICTID